MTSTPHVVLVTAHYPPSRAAGARRPHNLVRALRAAGWDVSVVTTGEAVEGWTAGTHGEKIHRVAEPELYRRAAAAPGAAGAFKRPREADGPMERYFTLMRREWIAARAFPDLWRETGRALSALLEARVQEVGAGIIVSTSPPMSLHRAASRVRRKFPHICWIADFRDPWIDPATQELTWHGTHRAGAARRLVRRILSTADHQVGASQGIGAWLTRQGATSVHVVLNGIPDEILDTPSPPVDRGVLRYVGEFYLGRDPRPLFTALGRLAKRNALPPAFRLDLIGDVTTFLGVSTGEALDAAGLRGVAMMRDRIPHPEAIAAIRSAGALLLLATGQPDQIPNKLYEYLGTRRPILAVVDADGESERLLRRAGRTDGILTPASTEADWDRAVAWMLEASTADPTTASDLEDLRTSRQLDRIVTLCGPLS